VTLDIQDEGPGIAVDRRGSVFEGDSTRAGGAGVGLRHSRALARAAGGDLELVASPRGACFRLTWPRADATLAPPPSVPSPPLLKGTRVLVVEDDEHVTLLLETALGARGAIVTIARNAEELASALLAGSHDAALVDLSPIASDVEGAIAALRKRSPDAALVFISGSAVGLPGVLAAESVRWVRKPFEVNELVAALLAAREKKS
jgi:CheY-like chemotaxis protein